MRNTRDNYITERLLPLIVCLFLAQIAAGRIIYVDVSVVSGNTYYVRIVGSAWYSSSGFVLRILDNNDNSNHVVTGSSTNETAILDGFTITSGDARDSYPDSSGGGMYNYGGSPKLANCTFIRNISAGSGSGMYNDHSSPTLVNCTFTNNSVRYTGGGIFNMFSHPTITNCVFKDNSTFGREGGGIYNDWYSDSTITNCVFSGNRAEVGGGILISNSNPTITNCTFSRNSAIIGGGICNYYYSSPKIMNCRFSNNYVEQSGGGMYGQQHSNILVTNCSFIANSAPWGGGGMCNYKTGATVANCVFWDNTAYTGPQILLTEFIVSLDHCNIQGGLELIHIADSNSSIDWGTGNIDVEPLLTPDGHLRGSSLHTKTAGTKRIITTK